MRVLRIIQRAAVGLACLGVIVPQAQLSAAAPRDHDQAVVDVALGPGGTLIGQVVDDQGIGIDGAAVSIRQGDQEAARVVTNKNGWYQADNLRGGFYQVVGGQGAGLFRLWAANTAPPSAQTGALVVSSTNTVRAQGLQMPSIGGVDPITFLIIAGVTTSTVFSVLAYDESKDTKDLVILHHDSVDP